VFGWIVECATAAECIAGRARVASAESGFALTPAAVHPRSIELGHQVRLTVCRVVLLVLPSPGDLVFFKETWDRNRDGKMNDGLAHVGVVESIDTDGTVTFVHRSGSGMTRARLNLDAPLDGSRNDFLRDTRTARRCSRGSCSWRSPRRCG
jgi:hypothetical protein